MYKLKSHSEYQARTAKPIMNLMMLGDSSVGKSSLLDAYQGKEFAHKRFATMGIDFCDIDYKPQSFSSLGP